ncbi:RNA 2',3'-cyclic phosphodiesterase [Paenibacillus sp. SYP-B3998]|uniref:RNA 2',3'-cyclic phosphodiesterase n=1 Tax=Paenibacillus sp. SYP-B3998 TaxID=2678564 RepID=A0A6G4A363_9BACL|nr:RNA 2',3'-cyclic phosphodiesterase [Paenibacillus sp. SYP-B3998]NEW08259.1 RNA 2',3'-cyclic phosphodiesterase [Paenibacillus sp. SYP-B3998]
MRSYPSSSMTADTYRLFVGLQLTQEAQEVMTIWKDTLEQLLPFSKWTHPLDVHITLKFLGNTTAEIADLLTSDLRQMAAASSPLVLHVEGLGVFGPQAAPSILWAGVGGDLSALNKLQHKVEDACNRRGFATEARPYRPHLTLARRFRAASGPFQRSWLEVEAPTGGWPTWQAGDIVLYRSHLGQQPAYERLDVFPLGDLVPSNQAIPVN